MLALKGSLFDKEDIQQNKQTQPILGNTSRYETRRIPRVDLVLLGAASDVNIAELAILLFYARVSGNDIY
jgi:glycerol-3-phosphate cytidylyltransferase-like family protein